MNGRGRWLSLAGVVLGAVLVCWPAAIRPGDGLLGHPEGSAGCHAWLLWVTGHHLLPEATLWTDRVFFPAGADLLALYGSDGLSPLLLGPLTRWWRPETVLDLWIVGAVLANGLATWALARDRGLGPAGALVAAWVYQAAPFFQQEILNGTTELVFAPALPLFALFGLRFLHRPRIRTGVALAAVAALGTWASVYTPFFLGVVALVVLGHRATTRLGPLLKRGSGRALGVAAGVGGAAVAPWVALHLALFRESGGSPVHARRLRWGADQAPLPDGAADLLAFFDPRPLEIPVEVLQPDGRVLEYWTLGSVTLGLVALGLALWGLRRRPVPRGPWLALLGVGLLVALGPWLVVGGETVRVGGVPVPLPSLAIRALFPPFGFTALHTYRYAAVAVLGLALLAGRGAEALPGRGLAWAAAVAVLAESLLASPSGWPLPRTPAPDEPAWQQLARAEEGAVVLLPFRANDLGDLSRGLLVQTRHHRPWVDGGIHFRAPSEALSLYKENALLAWLTAPAQVHLPDAARTRRGWRDLRERGVNWVVLDRERFPEAGPSGTLPRLDRLPDVEAWLRESHGEPVADDGAVAVFSLAGGEDAAPEPAGTDPREPPRAPSQSTGESPQSEGS